MNLTVSDEPFRPRVIIYDWKRTSNTDDRALPRAVVSLFDYNSGQCIVPDYAVDIVKSVQVNPASLGHVAIQIAIKRWFNLVCYYFHVSPGPKRAGRGKSSRHPWYKIAADHLKRVGGHAIVEHAERSALSKQLALYIRYKDQVEWQHGLLRMVWELLRTAEIQSQLSSNALLRALKAELDRSNEVSDWGSAHTENVIFDAIKPSSTEKVRARMRHIRRSRVPTSETAYDVLAFLQSDEGGRFQRSPGKLASIRLAFDSWYLSKDPRTLQEYLGTADKEVITTGIVSPLEREKLLYPATFNYYHLCDVADRSIAAWLSPLIATPLQH